MNQIIQTLLEGPEQPLPEGRHRQPQLPICTGALDGVGLAAAPTNSNVVQYKGASCHKAESDTS